MMSRYVCFLLITGLLCTTVVQAEDEQKTSPTHRHTPPANNTPAKKSVRSTPISVSTLRIEELHGKARLRDQVRLQDKLQEKKIDPAHLCQLTAGNEVICDQGELVLIVYGITVKRKPGQGWYKIPPPDRRLKADLDRFFQLTGRARTDTASIFSPPYTDGTVRVDTLVFRWIPLTEVLPATLSLSVNEREIWSQKSVDAKSGKLDSETARDILRTRRAADPTIPITFRLSAGQHQLVAIFTLLSAEEENALDQELTDAAGSEMPFLLHMRRANAFSAHRLYAEAAQEYEQVLEIDPERLDLILATIKAEERTGNVARAKELRKRVPANISTSRTKSN